MGDTRTRTIAITVNGIPITTWSSSGETKAFEFVDIGVEGSSLELRGVLADSEWLSIMEVNPGLGVPLSADSVAYD